MKCFLIYSLTLKHNKKIVEVVYYVYPTAENRKIIAILEKECISKMWNLINLEEANFQIEDLVNFVKEYLIYV